MSASPKERGAAATAAPRITNDANSTLPDHRKAALALLNNQPKLAIIEARFLGQLCVTRQMSNGQRDWLIKLLARHNLPSLTSGGAK